MLERRKKHGCLTMTQRYRDPLVVIEKAETRLMIAAAGDRDWMPLGQL
jgi:hypothetical protein